MNSTKWKVYNKHTCEPYEEEFDTKEEAEEEKEYIKYIGLVSDINHLEVIEV